MHIDPILEKDGSLADLTNAEIGLFCKLLALAGQLEEGGFLGVRGVALTDDQLIQATRTPAEEGKAGLAKLRAAKVLQGNQFPTWSLYQDEYERKRQANKRKISPESDAGHDAGQKGLARAEQSRAEQSRLKDEKHPAPSQAPAKVKHPNLKPFTDWWVAEWNARFGGELLPAEQSEPGKPGRPERYSKPYIFAGEKDGQAAIRCLKAIEDVEYLKKLVIKGWETKDEFIAKNCRTLSGFSAMINRLDPKTKEKKYG